MTGADRALELHPCEQPQGTSSHPHRCILPGIPCHITQRGVDRRETFSSPHDRLTYLRLVREDLHDSQLRMLAYCLMTNHIHLIAVPAREDSLAVLLRRARIGSFEFRVYRRRCSGLFWVPRAGAWR